MPAAPNSTALDDRPPVRRLHRRRRGRMVGGVALGLAAHYDIDVVVVRVLFVVATFIPFPGFGLLVYVALLFLMPTAERAGMDERTARDTADRGLERGVGFWLGLGLIVFSAAWLLGIVGLGIVGPFGSWGGRGPGLLLPLLLIGLGIALWVDADRRSTATAPAPPPAPAPTSSPTPAERMVATAAIGPGTSTEEAAEPAGPDGPGDIPQAPPEGGDGDWSPPPETRQRSPLGRVTMALALLLAGLLWLLDQLRVIDVGPTSVLAATLLVIGLGLLVGAFAGRARWLAAVGLLLVPVVLAGMVMRGMGLPIGAGMGERAIRIDDPAELAGVIELGAGAIMIDLTGLETTPDDPLEVRVAAGEIRVVIPDGAGVTGVVRAEMGELDVFGTRFEGIDLERELAIGAAPGAPTIAIDLRVGAGPIKVLRASDARERWGEWHSSWDWDPSESRVITEEVGR